MDREELLRDIAALGEELERLGVELIEAARALQEHGMLPSPRSLEAIEWARKRFERLRAQVLELAQGAEGVVLPALDDVRSLRDLLALLDAVEARQRRRAALEQARHTALVLLDRVQTLAHRDTPEFPPLVSSQAHAAELRIRVATAPDLHPDVEALVTGRHPLAMLIALVQRFSDLEDEHWEQLRDAVAAELGRPLALAASRGKLVLGHALDAGRPAPPEAPATAPPRPASAGTEGPVPPPAPEAPATAPPHPASAGTEGPVPPPAPDAPATAPPRPASAGTEGPVQPPAPEAPATAPPRPASAGTEGPVPPPAPEAPATAPPRPASAGTEGSVPPPEVPAAPRTRAPRATTQGAAPAPAPSAVEPEEPILDPLTLLEPSLSPHAEPAARAAMETLERGSFGEVLSAEASAWLTVSERMRSHLGDLTQFAQDVRRLGYTHAIVIGASGAVAAPRAYAGPFPSKLGFPELVILDSLDPETIRRALDHLDLLHTLFVVCARGDLPAETAALYRLCRERADATLPGAGKQFVAIAEAGSRLETFAGEQQFRRIFLTAPELGEAQAALSWPGLVPAALIGVNLSALLARAEDMARRIRGPAAAANNPGIALGALARAGRNKVTFALSPKLEAFGSWLDQLLSGVASPDGRGLVPIVGESLGGPASYRSDRFFVGLTLAGDSEIDTRLSVLELVDQPIYRIVLRDSLDLAGEMVRWQIAAATAARLLGIPPDGRRRAVTPRPADSPRRPRLSFDARPQAEEDGIRLYLEGPARPASVVEGLGAYLTLARPGGWVTLLSYLPAEAEVEGQLHALRTRLRDRLRLPVRLGRSMGYLQAVGALAASTAPNDLFIQITGDDRDDLAVPGERTTFGGLKRAQVQADLGALRDAGRRVIRLHVKGAPADGVHRLAAMLDQAAGAGGPR